jgi:lipopolysaccharide transport system permease protein
MTMRMADGVWRVGRELTRYRYLLWMLTLRELTVRYRQSLLGPAWAVLLPLSMMLIFTFVFARAVSIPGSESIAMPYSLYAFAGLVPWTFLAGSLSQCVNSLVANRSLVTKVYFPREVFPLSCILSSLVDFGMALVVLAGLMVHYHLAGEYSLPSVSGLFFVPIVVGIQIVWTMAVGMLLAMANLHYRDIRQVFQVGIHLLMFLSAVVVPLPSGDGLLMRLLRLNPLVGLIEAYRDCLLKGKAPDFAELAYAGVVSTVALLIAWVWFRRASARFAEVI